MSTRTTTELGINSARIIGTAEFARHVPTILHLLERTREAWEFYYAAEDLIQIGRQNVTVILNEGEVYAICEIVKWHTGKQSLICLWADGPKIDTLSPALYEVLQDAGRMLKVDRLEMPSCARGYKLLRGTDVKPLYRTLYKDL